MRLSLARALFCEPDLLLLDEPTNNLDCQSVAWLEWYLQRYKNTLLVVSHARDFLNAICTDVLHFQNDKTLVAYSGNYDSFEQTRMERLKNMTRAKEAQEAHQKHIMEFVNKFRANAKRASMVQSRLKQLQKMPFLPTVMDDPDFNFQFADPDPLPGILVQLKNVSFRYSADTRWIFQNVDLSVTMDSRIALIGDNGQGKSTLLQLISEDLKPLTGYADRNPRLRIGRFSQHHVDQLDLDLTALEYFRSEFPGHEILEYRAHLGKYGISNDLALQQMDTLSGGQKSRVVFAYLSWLRPHLMLLDEPSNHLDLETVEALVHALETWEGGVLLVSHDERLITNSCNELWVCHDGKVVPFKGDYASYKKKVIQSFD